MKQESLTDVQGIPWVQPGVNVNDNAKVLLPPPVAGMNIPKDVDLAKLECDIEPPVSNWKPDNTISLVSVILQFISAMVAAFISYLAIKKKKE